MGAISPPWLRGVVGFDMTFSSSNPPPKRKRASEETVAKLTAPSDRKAHYRLSNATWEIILAAYKQGATAKELSEQWRVSEHAIRKRITVHEATKRDWGDAEAIRQAEARLEQQEAGARAKAEAEASAAEAASPGARAAVLFSADVEPDETVEPGGLAYQATVASGRAMRSGLWSEAKALSGLAESYTRLQERKRESELTPENAPLGLIVDLVFGSEGRWLSRMSLVGARDNDPDTPIKHRFWQRKERRDKAEEHERSVRWSKAMGEYGRGLVDGRRGAEQYWRGLAEAQGVVLPVVSETTDGGEPYGPPEY